VPSEDGKSLQRLQLTRAEKQNKPSLSTAELAKALKEASPADLNSIPKLF
jgi:hypothetical protein